MSIELRPPCSLTSSRFDECKRRWTERILADGNLALVARNLGYPDHTAIHEAVKPVIAENIASFLARYCHHDPV